MYCAHPKPTKKKKKRNARCEEQKLIAAFFCFFRLLFQLYGNVNDCKMWNGINSERERRLIKGHENVNKPSVCLSFSLLHAQFQYALTRRNENNNNKKKRKYNLAETALCWVNAELSWIKILFISLEPCVWQFTHIARFKLKK